MEVVKGVCANASTEQVQHKLAHIGDGVYDFEGDAVQTNANAEFCGGCVNACR